MTTPREDVYRVLAEVEPCGDCGRETEFTDLVVWADGFISAPEIKKYTPEELIRLGYKHAPYPGSKYCLLCTQCSRNMYNYVSFDYLKSKDQV